MPNQNRFLVLSDLHTSDMGKHLSDTHLSYSDSQSEFADGLVDYLAEINPDCNTLVCAGDIATRASGTAFQKGWSLIHRLREALQVETLLAVPGNHDHDSQGLETVDPKTIMQFVNPPFPSDDFDSATHFWAWNWCLRQEANFNAVLLNTSAYHGVKNEDTNHGRIIPEIQQHIVERLKNTVTSRPVNFLICHHHPVPLPGYGGLPDTQAARGGQELLESLVELEVGPWMIFHGHRHTPRISYAPSRSSTPPLIFSAGSLSAKLNSHIPTTSNQFYVVELDLDETKASGRVCGTFETHEWSVGRGWRPSRTQHLPAFGGFGCGRSPMEIASEIEAIVGNERLVDADGLRRISRAIRFVTPFDLEQVTSLLKKNLIVVNHVGATVLDAGRMRR